jgi:hypothetical protein
MYNEQYRLVMYTGHSRHMERDCMGLEVKVVLAQLKQQITQIKHTYTHVTQPLQLLINMLGMVINKMVLVF